MLRKKRKTKKRKEERKMRKKVVKKSIKRRNGEKGRVKRGAAPSRASAWAFPSAATGSVPNERHCRFLTPIIEEKEEGGNGRGKGGQTGILEEFGGILAPPAQFVSSRARRVKFVSKSFISIRHKAARFSLRGKWNTLEEFGDFGGHERTLEGIGGL